MNQIVRSKYDEDGIYEWNIDDDLQLANNTLPRDCAKDVTCNSLDIPNHRRGLLLTHPSIFFHFAKQFSFKPLQTSLTKTTSLMETILSNSMPISVSSLPPVRAVPSPRKLEFSSFTPKTTLFGSRSQRKLGFRCSPRRAAVTCGGVTEIKESQFSDVVLKADGPVLVEFVATWCGPCRLISLAMEAIA
eukprot:XP_019078103.1 PREDICTED: thioredoxin X, chloroplastic-like [Vitis vinifera]